MARHLIRVLIVWLVAPATVVYSADVPPEHTLRFEVSDSRDTITREIDPALLLRVVRIAHSRVANFGWEVQVTERGVEAAGDNLLRRGIPSAGPHPSDVLAWLSRERRFPDDRRLPLPGYPYEIRIRLINCRTQRLGADTGFVSGTIEITWRRLDVAAQPARERFSRSAVIP